ncbi:hypothetical protein BDB01DRAFT_846373 [Pilobolus umbonatus]|nr:hypothetical protein BDB01DRAFT_846373 [Pilobolus umbonatus]
MLSSETPDLSSPKPNNTKRHSKKPTKKKSTVHPHIEYIEGQIDQLKSERTLIETLHSKEDLTDGEEQLIKNKDVIQIKLDQLESILSALNTPSMNIQLRNHMEKEKKLKAENQMLSLLHFFYLIRVGQQGLFTLLKDICPHVKLEDLTTVCDKLVGAAVYASKDSSQAIRGKKRLEVFDILKKLERGVDEPIDSESTTTYKQLRKTIDHIWDNTVDEKSLLSTQHMNEEHKQEYNWLILPFQNMLTSEKDTVNEQPMKSTEETSMDITGESAVRSTSESVRSAEESLVKSSTESVNTVGSVNSSTESVKSTAESVKSSTESVKSNEGSTKSPVESVKSAEDQSESVGGDSYHNDWRMRDSGDYRGRGRAPRSRARGRGRSIRGIRDSGRGRGRGRGHGDDIDTQRAYDEHIE